MDRHIIIVKDQDIYKYCLLIGIVEMRVGSYMWFRCQDGIIFNCYDDIFDLIIDECQKHDISIEIRL